MMIDPTASQSNLVEREILSEDVQIRLQLQERALEHAKIQLLEVASSKSWKLISIIRIIEAGLFKGGHSFAPKLGDALHMSVSLFKTLVSPHDQYTFPHSRKTSPYVEHPITRRHDIAVILHLFYPDLWEEIFACLSHLNGDFDLYVSIPKNNLFSDKTILDKHNDTTIYRCDNRGRDIAPFLEIFSDISSLGYRYICKIHTKKSPQQFQGESLRQYLIKELLGSEKTIKGILEVFDQNPDLGMVVPEGYAFPVLDLYGMMYNYNNLKILSLKSGVDLKNLEFQFPAGSMFWFRPQVLLELENLGIITEDFQVEKGQLDGTLAHALERFLGILVYHHKMKLVETGNPLFRN